MRRRSGMSFHVDEVEDDADDMAEHANSRNGAHNTINASQDSDGNRPGGGGREEGPACVACRRKKARCSRQQPCSHCVKDCRECVYDVVKNKPGMRPGAVEQLTQRLAKLENMFLGQGLVWQEMWKHIETLNGTRGSSASHSPRAFNSQGIVPCDGTLQERIAALGQSLATIGHESQAAGSMSRLDTSNDYGMPRSAKRPRLDHEDPSSSVTAGSWDPSRPLPDDLVDALVDIYFDRVHPWIPMLHIQRFRQALVDPVKRSSRSTILHAITSCCLRFSSDPRVADAEVRKTISKRSREIVILQSMEVFSVVNLQALIICAFDTIASGRGPSSWSIVGSMARTVEQLHLGVEEEDQYHPDLTSNGMISRMPFLLPSLDWCEEEERRRVFWNVMLMDRFCSISTGWNLSLTNADARRRLPCEGGLWEKAERIPYPTPHFGVSEHPGPAAAAALPSEQATGPRSQDFLGGFAYAIEATENLSLVTSFCLQQAVDVSRSQQVQLWLMNFKQLDLRLMQWKLFLPDRWKEACAVNADGNMDPNLTLAHITHNTAVVLLHQGMAYPSPIWHSTSYKLPSSSSAETCVAAAIEVSTIAENYLRNTTFLANHQFAFCLFVCGRMLLAHAAYLQIPLATQSFDSLVLSLREIAARWDGRAHAAAGDGTTTTTTTTSNLASKFASRLQEARDLGPQTYDIRQAAYSEQQGNGGEAPNRPTAGHVEMEQQQRRPVLAEAGDSQMGWSPAQISASGRTECSTSDNLTLAFPPLPQALQQPQAQTQTQAQAQAQQLQKQGMGGDRTDQGLPQIPQGSLGHPIGQGVGGGATEDQPVLDQLNLNDIYSYLNGALLPEQRISIYSQ